MGFDDLTFDQWDALPEDAAARIAAAIAAAHGLDLIGVRHESNGGRPYRVAGFARDGMEFVLVPGGRVTLGYEGGRFAPTEGQAASYAVSAAEYGLPPMAEFVDAMTSQSRTVDLPAMVVAVEAYDACATALAPDDPRVLEVVASAGDRRGGGVQTFRPGGGLRVEFDASGQVARARLSRRISADEAFDELGRRGLRPTTPDEWEWACGAGATTLFRWGDSTPEDGYPYDHKTGPHREPNRWGLSIGQDPYKHEWTTDRGVVCGGDGGGATCGGSGFFLGWLTLATAYRDTDFGQWLMSADRYVDEILIRPVVDLT